MSEILRLSRGLSRRDFVKITGAASVATAFAGRGVFAAGSDTIRVALIGCGRRGYGAAKDCIHSSPGVQLVALADVLQERLDGTYNGLKREQEEGQLPEGAFQVTPETCFLGFDAYKKVMALDNVDLVLLTTPPGFRPVEFEAAVAAGKHVFMEKPVAVDPAGVRKIIETAKAAKEKKLGVVGGTQRRHQDHYVEVMKRIHDGAIGEIVSGQVYWIGDYGYYMPPRRRSAWSDMEWQIRNWNYYVWMSGDHIVEQHVHNLDVMCWVMGEMPVKCLGMGGRQQRVGPEFGHIYDHFSVEFEFPNGARITSLCRQMDQTSHRVSESFVGTLGKSYTDQGGNGSLSGPNAYKFETPNAPNPYVQEHTHLIASIRAGEPLMEAETIALSTMTGVLGRMSAYTGRELNWSWGMNASKLDLFPETLEFGPMPEVKVPIPGQEELV